MAGFQKVGAWEKATALLATAGARAKHAARQAVLQEAHFFRKKIVEGMREQAPGGKAFKPLAPTTMAIRQAMGFKGEKALIRRGDLRNSIKVEETSSVVFVGVLNNATNKDGKKLVNIGITHEFGGRPVVLPVTPKMRKFLHFAFEKAGLPPKDGLPTGVIVVRVPARPFLSPVFQKYGSKAQVQARMGERLRFLLTGHLSK